MSELQQNRGRGFQTLKTKKRELRGLLGAIHLGVFLILLASFFIQFSAAKSRIRGMALITAQHRFEKDLEYRLWAASHGGFYVPVTEETQANPYLDQVEERDIETPSGKKLTLMNPAYMSRQVYEITAKKGIISNHITSLNPIRPENKADEWETAALNSFGDSVEEVYSLISLNDKTYFRFMKPLFVEEACLKCHAQQGYSSGQIRGGISLLMPYDSFQKIESRTILTLLPWHIALLVLIVGLVQFFEMKIVRALVVSENSLSSTLEKEKELNIALIKAEESDKLKSAFLANMSHEIRTPLNAIMGFSDLLEDVSIQQDEKKTYLKLIQDNGDNLLNIINDILDISLIEAGQFVTDKSLFDIKHLLESIHLEYSKHLEIKDIRDIKLQLDVTPTQSIVQSDQQRIRQIISNLIENAIKYTGNCVISFGYSWENEASIRIFVRDTGQGIPPEQLTNIFKVFRRLEKGPSDPRRGAGLGLSLVKNLSEALGGEVSVESELGHGTKFTVILPVDS